MKYEDLSFTTVGDNGEELICDILSVIPSEENNDEPYVVYTDYLLDEEDKFIMQYGKLVKENEEYVLKPIVDEYMINSIKEKMTDEVISYVNEQIQESMYE